MFTPNPSASRALPVPPPGAPVWRKTTSDVVLSEEVLYIDGSVKSATMGTGWVWLREGESWNQGALKVATEFSRDSTLAEAYAWLFALKQAGDALVGKAVTVLTDSYELVSHWHKYTEGAEPRYAVFKDITEHCARLGAITLQAIDRKDNAQANALARRSLGLAH